VKRNENIGDLQIGRFILADTDFAKYLKVQKLIPVSSLYVKGNVIKNEISYK
jgi:hypothetical protein